MATRPTTVPQLDTTKSNRTAPAGSKITSGYVLNDFFPSDNANYLMGWAGDWLEWLQERTEDGTTPTIDLVLRGLDALTATGDGGTLTLKGGDGGSTSGDGGDILLLPGAITSGVIGRVGIGTSTPIEGMHFSWSEAVFRIDNTDTTKWAEIYFATDDSGTEKSSWEVGCSGPSAADPGVFYINQVKDNSGTTLDQGRLKITHAGDVSVNEALIVEGSQVYFNSALDDYILHDNVAVEYQFWLNNVERWTFSNSELDCHSSNIVNVAEIIATDITCSAGTPELTVETTNPTNFAQILYMTNDSGTEKASWEVGASGSGAANPGVFYVVKKTDNTGATINLGCIRIESNGDLVANQDFVVEGRQIYFGVSSDDYLLHDDTANDLGLWLDGAEEWTFSKTELDCQGNDIGNGGHISCQSTRVVSQDSSPTDGTEAYRRTIWNHVVCSGWFTTLADGTVNTSDGWNVINVQQVSPGLNTYEVTHDANLDSECTVQVTLESGTISGQTGALVPLGKIVSNKLRVLIYDGADNSAGELISGRVFFAAIGRSTVLSPTL
jgi:hypothetical protein